MHYSQFINSHRSLFRVLPMLGLVVLTAGLTAPANAGGLDGIHNRSLLKPGLIKARPAVNRNQLFQKNLQTRPHLLRPRTCPDLVIQRLHINNIQYYNGNYIIRLAGVVRNIGSADYRSGPNQQSVRYSGPGLIANSLRFGNVPRGGSVPTGAIFRTIKGGEFTPDITATLSFGPDISSDNNPGNDECNTRNNKTVLSRTAINQVIAGYNRTHARR